jgi:hypothetical protein
MSCYVRSIELVVTLLYDDFNNYYHVPILTIVGIPNLTD